MSRTLVFAMTHLRTETEGKLLRVWQEMREYLDTFPYDLLIVDSASPIPVDRFLLWPDEWKRQQIPDDDTAMFVSGPRNILQFKDSRGHPFTMASERAPAPIEQ